MENMMNAIYKKMELAQARRDEIVEQLEALHKNPNWEEVEAQYRELDNQMLWELGYARALKELAFEL